MELAIIIWAVGVLPIIGVVFTLLGAAVTLIALFGKIFSACAGVDRKDKAGEGATDYAIANISHKSLLIASPIWLFGLLIPTEETSYQMLAAYGVQTIVENPYVQNMASDGVDVLQALMKKAKAELEKEEE